MRKKCLLIGGCGFLLSNFVRKCLYAKDETLEFVTLDKLLYKHSIQNYYANKHHKLHIGDVCDFHQLKSIINLEKPDIIIFGAGDKTINSIQTKLVGLDNLSKLSSQFERLIYLSDVYLNETDSFPENLEDSFECSSELFIDQSKLNYNILRLSDIYGPRQKLTEDIASLINYVLKDLEVSNLLNIKSPLYVDDFCSALMTVIEGGQKNTIYSVGSSKVISAINICSYVKKIHDNQPKERLINEILQNCNYPAEQLLRDLGWSQQFSLFEGLQETYNWYKNNSWFGRQNEIL